MLKNVMIKVRRTEKYKIKIKSEECEKERLKQN